MTQLRRSRTQDAHTPLVNGMPDVFCWTKMGAEAGQSLDAIIRRKELERLAGDGTFAWGIGNSLGLATHAAREASPHGEVDVLFTPMKSAPKQADISPGQVLIWLGYRGADGGMKDLPAHMLVTSRGGPEKKAHYALLCHSEAAIDGQSCDLSFAVAEVRNFVSNNPIGASQVTSVVRYESGVEKMPKAYSVALRAKLFAEGFVRLTQPVAITSKLQPLYEQVCQAKTVIEWKAGIRTLKSLALKEIRHSQPQCALL